MSADVTIALKRGDVGTEASQPRRMSLFLLAGWTVCILYGSFIPFQVDPQPVAAKLAALDLFPFQRGIKNFSGTDVLSNLALFVPFGFLLIASMPTLRDRGALACALAAAVPALVLTIAIEAGQLFVAGRVVSGLDVEAETFGAVLGALAAWRLADRAEDVLAAALDTARGDPRILGLSALAYYLVVHAFFPFEVTIDPGAVLESVRAGHWVPWPPRRFWADVLVERGMAFALVAGLLRSWLEGTTPRCSARGRAFSLAVGVLASLELGKIFFVGRSPDVANTAIGAAGAAFGSLVPAVTLTAPTPWMRRAALALLSVALLVWAELTPFVLAPSEVLVNAGMGRIEWLPFVAYFYGDPRRVLLDLGDKVLLSGFVGLAFARLAGRLTVGVAVAGLSGLVLEAAQVLTPARTPSVTDALIFIGGGFIGSEVARRLDGRAPGRPGA